MSRTPIAIAIAASLAIAGIAIAAPQATPQPANAAKMKLDANNDGVIDRTEAAKHPRLAERFDALDKNKGGRLSADERPMHRGMRGGKRGHGGGMQLDADNDGRISRAEAAGKPQFAQRFEQMDANKDGFIDKADREARMQARRAEWFGAADTNRDGQISRAEYDAAHAKRTAEWEQRKAARGNNR